MTISDKVREQGIEIDYLISSMKTTSANTGWRMYSGRNKNGRPALIKHNEGTAANAPKTTVYSREEAILSFAWEINEVSVGRYPEFEKVAKYIEHM